jgi:hypothetical protein
MVIDFLSVSVFWLALWALREFEQRRRFKNLAEEIEALQKRDQERVKQIETLEAREQKHLQMIALARGTAGAIANQLALSRKAPLPPAANPSNGQQVDIHPLRVRVTTGLPAVGSPAFSGREQ